MITHKKMLMTEKQTDERLKWFTESYEQYCPKLEDGKLWIPTIYSDNPEETEEKHKQIWLEEIKNIMWKDANKKYTHRWGRTETYAEAQFNSLWLYIWPYFKHISEKEDVKDNITWQEDIWNLWQSWRMEHEGETIESKED